MGVKSLALTLGVGAAVGAVAVLMMPRSNPTRKLAAKAAEKVEDAAWRLTDKITDQWDL
jgi:gas vesicle protein